MTRRISSRRHWKFGRAEADTNYQQAISLAWDIIQLLERPGDELPEVEAIREACRAAGQLNAVCKFLQDSAGIFDLGDQDDHSPFLF